MKRSRVGKGKSVARTRGRPRAVLAAPRGARWLLRVERQVARLRLSPDKRFGAQVLYGCAIVSAVGMALGAHFLEDDLWWGELLAVAFLGMGFLYGLGDRETRLDFRKQRLFHGKAGNDSVGVPLAHLVGIVAQAHTVVVRTSDTSHEVRRFVLGLLVAEAGAPLTETLASLRRDRAALVRGEQSPGTDEVSARLDGRMQAQMLVVVDYPDETAVWQASEWLAKQLDLPLIDGCSSPTVVRVPEELDLSLGERLARGLQAIEETEADAKRTYASAPAPAGAQFERQRGVCTLSWRQSRRFDLLFASGMVLLFPALGLLLRGDSWSFFWALAVPGACMAWLPWVVAQWHGTNRITLDRKRLVITRGPFGQRLPALSLDSIEAVRIGGTSEAPMLTLVTDQRVLRMRMAPPVARWAKQHIERQLLASYERSLERSA